MKCNIAFPKARLVFDAGDQAGDAGRCGLHLVGVGVDAEAAHGRVDHKDTARAVVVPGGEYGGVGRQRAVDENVSAKVVRDREHVAHDRVRGSADRGVRGRAGTVARDRHGRMVGIADADAAEHDARHLAALDHGRAGRLMSLIGAL